MNEENIAFVSREDLRGELKDKLAEIGYLDPKAGNAVQKASRLAEDSTALIYCLHQSGAEGFQTRGDYNLAIISDVFMPIIKQFAFQRNQFSQKLVSDYWQKLDRQARLYHSSQKQREETNETEESKEIYQKALVESKAAIGNKEVSEHETADKVLDIFYGTVILNAGQPSFNQAMAEFYRLAAQGVADKKRIGYLESGFKEKNRYYLRLP